MHSSLLNDRSNPQAAKDNWDKIIQAGEKIVQGAELPPLGEREIQVLAAPKSKANPPLNTDASPNGAP